MHDTLPHGLAGERKTRRRWSTSVCSDSYACAAVIECTAKMETCSAERPDATHSREVYHRNFCAKACVRGANLRMSRAGAMGLFAGEMKAL